MGARVAEFKLTDAATAKPWAFFEETRQAKATVMLFLNASCPVSNAYVPRLLEQQKRFKKEGAVFVAIYSQATDSAEDLKRCAKEFAIPFPLLRDDGAKLARTLNVDRLPTALVLDATRTVRYAGRIDDQFAPGVHKANRSTNELATAIDAVLEGREVKVPLTEVKGCKLTVEAEAKPANVSFNKDVLPIVQTRCQDCHRPGEAGPFALMTYKDAAGWAGMIREVVSMDVMPPWHADAPRGHFANDRRLSAGEKSTLLAWIDAGCPEGDAKDAPKPRTFVPGWRLGREPDEILKMKKAVSVPAANLFGLGMPYSYVPVGEPFAEDKWVTAIEVRPEFRPAVHHIIAFLVPPGKTIYDVAGDEFGAYMLGAYVPGDQPFIAPPGMARKVAKGSKIIFEVHYTPMGRAGSDRSMVGLCYAKAPPKQELQSEAIFNGRLAIPPGEPSHEVKARRTFNKETVLLSLTPHMHVRGKSFKYDLVTPDGKTERLLTVPHYDFNWQVSYDLAKSRTIPAGSKIACAAVYDNSAKNPFNPDPSKRIRWGTQTWDEMMIGFLTYYER